MKFTFKTEKPTGSFGNFYPDTHHIKLNKIPVGQIVDKIWKIRLQVVKEDINEDGNPNCFWKWITLQKESQSLQEAKDFLNKMIDKIITKYKLINL